MQKASPSEQARLATPVVDTQPGPRRFIALKQADMFAVADVFGDIAGGDDGLFKDDTRILSRFRLLFSGEMPSLLSGRVSTK